MVEAVAELCRDSDLVGVSVMTNYFFKAADLSDRLRERISAPVVWGGAHPTVAPVECLDHADLVCIGEGERPLLSILEKLEREEEPEGIPNVLTRKESDPASRELYPPIGDLDSLPFPDYSLEDHHVLLGDRMVELDEDLLRRFCKTASNFDRNDEVIYEAIASRGCPYHCSFCINNRYLSLYEGHRFFRRRSMENLVDELERIRRIYPWFNRIVLQDDCFTATSAEDIRRFSALYRDRVGQPFFFLLNSTTMDEERVKPLLDAGVHKLQVGIQSASRCTNDEIYDRSFFSAPQLLERARRTQEIYDGGILVTYDIILDNPFEDVDSILQTLKLAIDLPRPKLLQLFSLTLFPGTAILERALREGVIDSPRAHYVKEDHDRELRYVNLLFTLANKGYPDWLVRALAWRPLVGLLESGPMRKLLGLFGPLYRKMLRERTIRGFRERFGDVLELCGGFSRSDPERLERLD